MTTLLPARIKQAIKSGPVPVIRDWRRLLAGELTRAERVMRFAEACLLVPEGKLVGQPLVLAEFQQALLYAIFDNKVPTRRAICSIARKNAKTATIAILLLAFLVGPEATLNARISSGALSRKQAAEVYNLASKMLMMSEKLKGTFRLVPSSKRIVGLARNTEYEALAAEGKTAHGGSPLVAILDEAGQVRGPYNDFFEAITTSQGAHEHPLEIWISTQAPAPGDLFNMLIDDAEAAKEPSTVCHVYAAPEDCELDDQDAWYAANPALGIFKNLDEMKKDAKKAKRMASYENTFRWLHLNQRVTADSPFISRAAWDACNGAIDERAFVEGVVYAGLDLSQTTDLTAFVLAAHWQEAWHVKPFFFMAEGLVQERSRADRVPYDVWVRQGHMETTPGKSVALDWVARRVVEECAKVNLKTLLFDRWRIDQLKIQLDAMGATLPLVEFGQGYKSMSPAVSALEEAVLHEKLLHAGHPTLTMCARNAVIVMDGSGGRKLDKSKATGRIDGMVALAMAIGGAGNIAEVEKPRAAPSIRVL